MLLRTSASKPRSRQWLQQVPHMVSQCSMPAWKLYNRTANISTTRLVTARSLLWMCTSAQQHVPMEMASFLPQWSTIPRRQPLTAAQYGLSPVWTLTQLCTDSLNAWSRVTFVWFVSAVNSAVCCYLLGHVLCACVWNRKTGLRPYQPNQTKT